MSDATPTHSQETPGADAGDPPGGSEPRGPVLTLVCETCGKDYFFDGTQPEPGMACTKCGGTVFRSFHETAGEAADDFRDTTGRDTNPDDAEGEVMPGDVMDLNTL